MNSLDLMLRELRLGTMVRHAQEVAIRAEREGWSFTRYRHDLMEMELLERGQRRIQKRLKESGLPTGKTLTTLELSRLPEPVRRQLPTLCEGHFIERGHNILAFGLPGRGKTHLLCAIGQALIERGYRVLFMPAFKLVQRVLTAKHELRLEKELRRLESQPQSSSMTSVTSSRTAMRWRYLFTFLAERYERKSVLISSNLVFSQWDRIFKDPMTTAAAIDRLVHHATILELTGPSYRTDKAKEKANEARPILTDTSPTLEEGANALSSSPFKVGNQKSINHVLPAERVV